MDGQLISAEDLVEAGISLPEDQIASFLQHANDTLNERIGAEITDSLTDDEVDEMLEVQDSGDARALQEWLIQHVPELKEIVSDERDILLGELVDQAAAVNQAGSDEVATPAPIEDEDEEEVIYPGE